MDTNDNNGAVEINEENSLMGENPFIKKAENAQEEDGSISSLSLDETPKRGRGRPPKNATSKRATTAQLTDYNGIADFILMIAELVKKTKSKDKKAEITPEIKKEWRNAFKLTMKKYDAELLASNPLALLGLASLTLVFDCTGFKGLLPEKKEPKKPAQEPTGKPLAVVKDEKGAQDGA